MVESLAWLLTNVSLLSGLFAAFGGFLSLTRVQSEIDYLTGKEGPLEATARRPHSGTNVKTRRIEVERKKQLLLLWDQRPDGRRTEQDLVDFYRDIEKEIPDLLSRQHGGDRYLTLRQDLTGHIESKTQLRVAQR